VCASRASSPIGDRDHTSGSRSCEGDGSRAQGCHLERWRVRECVRGVLGVNVRQGEGDSGASTVGPHQSAGAAWEHRQGRTLEAGGEADSACVHRRAPVRSAPRPREAPERRQPQRHSEMPYCRARERGMSTDHHPEPLPMVAASAAERALRWGHTAAVLVARQARERCHLSGEAQVIRAEACRVAPAPPVVLEPTDALSSYR
jgi:hypothetical protein